ncbi:MAG: hypothetical protein Q9163_005371 [Psora crenata]
MIKSLADLPAELLSQVILYIVTARDLSHLALTCKKIHSLIAKDGYRIFVQSRFPSTPISVPPFCQSRTGSVFWKDAARGLTTLSRNWDRKAFIAQRIGPAADAGHSGMVNFPRVSRLRHGGRGRQSMGFAPAIDSHEAFVGGNWPARKQRVIWSAGHELILGYRELPESLVGSQHCYRWIVYREPDTIDGRDDITYVQLLRTETSERQEVMVGRANGDLARITMAVDEPNGRHKRLVTFKTGGRPVRSANVNSDNLLAVCLSDGSLTLYPMGGCFPSTDPAEDLNIVPAPKSGKIWSTQFLRHDRLAVGYGPAYQPIKIFDLGRGGLTEQVNIAKSVRIPEKNEGYITSVFSLAPLPPSTPAAGQAGDLFLTGAFDGVVRLHDLRCADKVVGSYRDPVHQTPIYSLLLFGRERFLAGGAEYAAVKVFDLRMPGERMYYATDPHTWDYVSEGANVFIGSGLGKRGNISSPVYSLSRPSQCSPTFFVGLEENVVQVDLVSIMDKYPDPVYGCMPNTGRRERDILRKWRPHDRILRLRLCEHHASIPKLKMQRDVGLYASRFYGWDERWTSP